jgi:hypothetical protein
MIVTVCVVAVFPPQAVTAGDITVTFSTPLVRPAPDVPADARNAGRPVRDISDHGPLSTLVAGRIAALEVTWSDTALFRMNRETEDFLRRLLAAPQGSTVTHIPWAQMLGVPSVVATVEHTEGTRGSWHIWYGWPSIYCAYRDGRGTWWFGYWMEVEALRLP